MGVGSSKDELAQDLTFSLIVMSTVTLGYISSLIYALLISLAEQKKPGSVKELRRNQPRTETTGQKPKISSDYATFKLRSPTENQDDSDYDVIDLVTNNPTDAEPDSYSHLSRDKPTLAPHISQPTEPDSYSHLARDKPTLAFHFSQPAEPTACSHLARDKPTLTPHFSQPKLMLPPKPTHAVPPQRSYIPRREVNEPPTPPGNRLGQLGSGESNPKSIYWELSTIRKFEDDDKND